MPTTKKVIELPSTFTSAITKRIISNLHKYEMIKGLCVSVIAKEDDVVDLRFRRITSPGTDLRNLDFNHAKWVQDFCHHNAYKFMFSANAAGLISFHIFMPVE